MKDLQAYQNTNQAIQEISTDYFQGWKATDLFLAYYQLVFQNTKPRPHQAIKVYVIILYKVNEAEENQVRQGSHFLIQNWKIC